MSTTKSPYLPEEISSVHPDALSKEFWDRCARHELAFQRCTTCATFRNPPGPICFACRSTGTEWVAVSGEGSVYSFTVVTHGVHAALQEVLPFNVVLVEFADAPGVRLVSNVVDADPGELFVGMAVTLGWEETSSATLPRFAKA